VTKSLRSGDPDPGAASPTHKNRRPLEATSGPRSILSFRPLLQLRRAGTGAASGTLPAEIDGTPLPDLTDLHCEVVPEALSVAYPAAVAQGGR